MFHSELLTLKTRTAAGRTKGAGDHHFPQQVCFPLSHSGAKATRPSSRLCLPLSSTPESMAVVLHCFLQLSEHSMMCPSLLPGDSLVIAQESTQFAIISLHTLRDIRVSHAASGG
eukprot:2757534-Amphidinium_carterae.2